MSSTSRVSRDACCEHGSSASRYSASSRVGTAERDVGGRPHDRDRRAQLVRRVGHEPPLLSTSALPRRSSTRLKERRRAVELVAGGRHGQARVQRRRRDRLRLARPSTSAAAARAGRATIRPRPRTSARGECRSASRPTSVRHCSTASSRGAPTAHDQENSFRPRGPSGYAPRCRPPPTSVCAPGAGAVRAARRCRGCPVAGQRRLSALKHQHDVPGELGPRPPFSAAAASRDRAARRAPLRRRWSAVSADRGEAFVELLEQQPPMQPQNRRAERPRRSARAAPSTRRSGGSGGKEPRRCVYMSW